MFKWTQMEDGPGPRERIPAGKHTVKIVDVIGEGRSGPFMSRDGAKQVLLVMQDAQQREATQMLTLSEKAAWVVRGLVQACTPPFNLEAMERAGIELAHFANVEWAKLQLVNRSVPIDLEYEKGNDGKEYPRVRFLRPAPATDAAPVAATPAEHIPF
jgi:hypothetical protein